MSAINEKEEILSPLMDSVGEQGRGVACDEATVYKDEDGWQLMLECFMEPWNLGDTVEEARGRIHEYFKMGFGRS